MKQEFIDRFIEMKNISDDAKPALRTKRGLDFETLINDVLQEEKILLSRSYHTEDNSREQIDAAIEVYERVFLVEVKWVKSDIAASDLYSFLGKVENKFHGTLGLFISKNQLTQNFIRSLNTGRRQTVIIIHDEDLELLFSQQDHTFKEYIKASYQLLCYNNRTHYPVSEFIEHKNAQNITQKAVENTKSDTKSFIKNALNNLGVSNGETIADFIILSKEDKQQVFEFAIENFYYIWQSGFSDRRFDLTHKYLNLFNTLDGNEEFIEKNVIKYFSSILPKSLDINGRDEIWRLFRDYFKFLPENERSKFETFLIIHFAAILGDWDQENTITFIIEVLWKDFSERFKDDVAQFYLEIYVSFSRLNKFAQKQFANYLITNEMIKHHVVEKWLIEQFKSAKSSFTGGRIDTHAAVYLAQTYSSLAPYIGEERWEQLIHDYIL